MDPQHPDIKHDLTEDCVCGPRAEPVEREGGSIGWVYVHHSLGGQERYE